MNDFLSEIDNFQVTKNTSLIDLEHYIAPWKIIKDISTIKGGIVSVTITPDTLNNAKNVLVDGALKRIETPEGLLLDIEIIAPEPIEDPVVEEDIKKFLYKCEPFLAEQAFNWAMDIKFEKSKCDFYSSTIYKVFDLIQAKVEKGETLLYIDLNVVDFRLSKIDQWFLNKLGYKFWYGPMATEYMGEIDKFFYIIEW